jgi:hypothetical protein
MARSRNIKPGYFQNEDLAECHPLARILFAGLWCEADRAGRLEDRPKRIKAAVLPYDNCDVDELLEQLRVRGFIERYEVDGKRYIQIVEFAKHQTPHIKEAASTIPARDLSGASTVKAQDKNASSPSDSGFLIPDSLIPDSSNFPQQEDSRMRKDPLPREREEFHTPIEPTAAGRACKALRSAGVMHVNPSHPDLMAVLADGATVDEIRDAADEAVAKGKPNLSYVIATVRGRRRDAANASQGPPAVRRGNGAQNAQPSKAMTTLMQLHQAARDAAAEDSDVVPAIGCDRPGATGLPGV